MSWSMMVPGLNGLLSSNSTPGQPGDCRGPWRLCLPEGALADRSLCERFSDFTTPRKPAIYGIWLFPAHLQEQARSTPSV